jgi:hypothetical protein
MIQPVFSNTTTAEAEESCCSKTKCNKPEPSDNNDDCESNRCNPLMSCPTGNFYLLVYSRISFGLSIPSKQKSILTNDNRVLTQLTECWHPPEII